MFFKRFDYLPPDHGRPIPNKLLSFIWHFVRQMKPQFIAIFILYSLSAIILSIIPYFIQLFVEGLEGVESKDDVWLALKWPVIGFISLVLVIQPILAQAGNYIQARTLPNFSGMIRRQLALYMHQHSYNYYQNDFAGRLAGKVIETPTAMNEVVYALLGAILYTAILFIISLFLYMGIDFVFGVIAMAWFVSYAGLMFYYVPRIQKLAKTASTERSHMRGRFVDILSNILTVKLFARSRHEDHYFGESISKTSNAFQENDFALWRLWTAMEVITTVIWVATIVAAIIGWQSGDVSTAQFAMILPLTLQVTQTSWWVSEILTNLFQRLGEIQEGIESMVQEQHVLDKKDAKTLSLTKGKIEFKNVDFSYDNKTVFKGLNITIPAGQKVGLIGESGAGKSTLVQVFLRLYDIQSGSVDIDGQSISHVTQESLREHISVIPQMSDLLHRTIRENITYGRLEATEDEVIDAARKAHAHDFILELMDRNNNKSYDAEVGERGVRLSGGQRQRVAIARAILKDAPILILDEATSALDSESEKSIQNSMLDLMEGKTVLAIAHRLSTIAHLDRLLVMRDGEIIEDGSHEELLALGGYYAKLWGMQSGGFLKG